MNILDETYTIPIHKHKLESGKIYSTVMLYDSN